jgi:oligopeptide transport system substrate-binding protein
MAIDRRGLVENVLKGGSEPAQWFGRPGLEAAPTIETHPDLGIQHDPQAARAELQSYLDDVGLTADELNLTLAYAVYEASDRLAQAIQQMWASELGLNVQLASQEWAVYLDTVNSLRAPQIWYLGWCADYPDENNFLRDVFASGASGNPTDAHGNPGGGVMWKNEVFEDLVRRAAVESNAEVRVGLYAQAEEILVDTDAVIIPLAWSSRMTLTKPYVKAVFGRGGTDPLYRWDILPH